MKTKTIRTSVAKILFVFAPVLIANTVFSSCSKNDDNPKLQQNEYPSLPDPKRQTVTINDAERPFFLLSTKTRVMESIGLTSISLPRELKN